MAKQLEYVYSFLEEDKEWRGLPFSVLDKVSTEENIDR